MRDEVVQVLAPAAGEVFFDCTLGGGGHAEALLEAADCRVVGLDRDPSAIEAATERLARFGPRFVAVRSSFSRLAQVAAQLELTSVDGVLADLGVSSPQLDQPERGFSFQRSGPIDMRMDPDADLSALDVVNSFEEDRIRDIISRYGEERRARRVARSIVRGRPWADTLSLSQAIAEAVGSQRGSRIHPATRSFQAIRIFVNDELGELERLLPAAVELLSPGGRLAMISFHSLEDRIVKQFIAYESGRTSPKDPYGHPLHPPRLSPSRKSLSSSPNDPNPRARSARLRTAVRLPWNA
ncbi:MAG: 16S rRNA (cytosine(1402)-N(4))-methyltransferase RsmH [Deltaproteobacteria bacterium]|nr:MAG: 16S rRNA (cytosine(1402)-N(4))-methyltransferase RsmH [Deltaproteobacteria bacterium]